MALFDDARDATYRVIHGRRDVRHGYLPDPVPDEALTRVLAAAHAAPSVGLAKPWDFLVVRSREIRERVYGLADKQRQAYADSLPAQRARAFRSLKIENILDTPVNIVVTCDPTRGGRHTFGRHTQPQTAPYSSVLAVQNLWLAATAEGLGVSWVSFFDERELARLLGIPAHLEIIAYLCLGYTTAYPAEPELASTGWVKLRPLSWAVHHEEFGRRGMVAGTAANLLEETLAAIGDPATATGPADWARRMARPLPDRLAGLLAPELPRELEPSAVVLFAADHGGASADAAAGAVRGVLAGDLELNRRVAEVGPELCVVDVGLQHQLAAVPGLLPRNLARSDRSGLGAPVLAAIETGIDVARDFVSAGNRCLVTGQLCNEPHHKWLRAVLESGTDGPAVLSLLASADALATAATAGFVLGAAAARTPVVVGGDPTGALAAVALAPGAADVCVAAEPDPVGAVDALEAVIRTARGIDRADRPHEPSHHHGVIAAAVRRG